VSKLPKYITKRRGRFRVIFPEGITAGKIPRVLGTFDTLRDAEAARDAALRRLQEPEIEGLTNEEIEYTPEELWQAAFKAQARVQKVKRKRDSNQIIIPFPERPFAIVPLSDFHIGSPSVDYIQLKKDVETIRDTPRMWAIFFGDGCDNWIVSKLSHLQRGQVLTFDAEVQLLTVVLETLSDKLKVVVAGNHDNWTRKLAGFDRIKAALRGTRVLYDPYEVVFDLCHGDNATRIKVRHQWKYASVFNATHGIEVGWERGGEDFDIGFGGHTHTGTLCRPFIRHGRIRYAILIGT